LLINKKSTDQQHCNGRGVTDRKASHASVTRGTRSRSEGSRGATAVMALTQGEQQAFREGLVTLQTKIQ